MTSAMQTRVAALEAAFVTVATERMAGVPVLNTALRVQALGFGLHVDQDPPHPTWSLGVLITPWFMNLVRLPLDTAASVPAVGISSARLHAGRVIDFIGAFEPAVGPFEACSLFSPMFEFSDQATAQGVAHEVLALLRPAATPSTALPATAASKAPAPTAPMPARRGFLLARSSQRSSPR